MNHQDPVQKYHAYKKTGGHFIGQTGCFGWGAVVLLAIWGLMLLIQTPEVLLVVLLWFLPPIILGAITKSVWTSQCQKKGIPVNTAYRRAVLAVVWYAGLLIGWFFIDLVLVPPGEKGLDITGIMLLGIVPTAVVFFQGMSEGSRHKD